MSKSVLKPVWKEDFLIRSFDIDFNLKLRLSSLCGFFQEIAGKHAEHLGFGYFAMRQSGLVWMLSRLFIEIHEYPSWEDTIAVETWPSGMERLFFRREFQVCKGKKKMISAVSYWLSLNIKTLRPQVFPIDETVIRHNAGRYAIDGVLEKIPPPATDIAVRSFGIRYSELDQNRHVNNTKYVDWIMDSFKTGLLEKSMPCFFGIEYKHEVKEQDIVQIRQIADPLNENLVLLEGVVAGTGHVCFRSKVVFQNG
ncbi:MAG: hypothetical protein JXB19_02655 [Bacteroidales bacterium]|nr:hypothetical protein [Bacteroidales bacterium]